MCRHSSTVSSFARDLPADEPQWRHFMLHWSVSSQTAYSGTYSVEFMVPPPFDKLGLDEAGAGLPFNAVDIKTN